MNATQRVHHQLPSKYQVEWKQTGIVLDKSESAAALGLNQLRIPQELLRKRRQELDESNHKLNGSYSSTTNHDNSDHTPGAAGSGDTNHESDTAMIEEENDDQSDKAIPDPNASASQESDGNDSANVNPNHEQEEEHLDQIFQQFLQDAKTLEEIRKDVVRTHPDLRFYLEPQDNLGIRRYAALERILFVWAKLNRGVRERSCETRLTCNGVLFGRSKHISNNLHRFARVSIIRCGMFKA